jgi:hypothetical protein
MLEHVSSTYDVLAKWLNNNQGVVGVAIFVITLLLGWLSGIFSALRRRPKFRLRLIAGPTFCCTFTTGAEHNGFPVHRTGMALYLNVVNVGSAPSSISSVAVGYHLPVQPLARGWFRYRLGWLWLSNQIVSIHDFQSQIGENVKVYPFLTQRSVLSGESANTYLQPGQATNGVVYFEQSDSWGNFHPISTEKGVRIKVALSDVFGKKHSAKFYIESVTMDHARQYNPSFGKTLAEQQMETLPHDA